MIQNNNTKKISFFKKIFIKISRILGYELIDQGNYEVATLNKNLDESLSIPGKKSITIPTGEHKITRKIKSLKIIFRSCTNQLIMDQNKKRLFEKNKNEYTFRSLNSLLKSTIEAKKVFNNIDFEILVTDTNSDVKDLNQIKKILSKYEISNQLISVNPTDYKEKIIGKYSEAKFANMANLYNSIILAKNEKNDLIYFVEDDYVHTKISILEMLFSYEKFSSICKKEIFLLPADYPYLYSKNNYTKIFLGHITHWRLVNESLVTFLTSKEIINTYLDKFMEMATKWEDPWEAPLHKIYEKVPCFSPIPSLSMHCANINSEYGLPPNINWKKIWDDSNDYK
tara:strand:- start:768 stop:1787 length:1020 start_codon:yes stop_codon:yes gene_type:complete